MAHYRPFIVFVHVMMLSWPRLVLGQGSEAEAQAMEHDRRASELFEAESYAEALAEMEAAQELLPATPRLYNIAACHERLGNHSRAIIYYQRFIESPDAPEERRAQANERLTALRQAFEVSVEETSDVESDERPDEASDGAVEERRGRLSPRIFWGLAGATVGLTACWVVTGALALKFQNDFEETYVNTQEGEDASKIGVPLAIATDAALGTSVALAVVTVVIGLFTDFSGLFGGRRSNAPTLTASGSAWTLSGRF